MTAQDPLLELRGVTKRFGSLVANDNIDFDLRRGEVHALLGENGAGKSTLTGTIYGLHRPDKGEIRLNGKRVEIDSPRRAIELGMAMVHQHFMLIPVMTVAENVVLASEPRRGPFFNRGEANRQVRELSDRFGLAVDPDALVGDLSVGEQQRVEILRALHSQADVVIMDEPTAVLTTQETADLFRVLRTLTAQGTAIIFISHKLQEVLEISDRVTVLRRGRKTATVETKEMSERELARLMVGRDVLFQVEKKKAQVTTEPLLEITDLKVKDERGLFAVDGVSFNIRGGEIVGIAGVDGNGQAELIEAIAGLATPRAGSVRVAGEDITGCGVRESLAAGVGHIPQDRHRRGLVLDFSSAENLSLRDYRKPPLARLGLVSQKRMRERSQKVLDEYDVRGATPGGRSGSLSGGNQQKLVIARELAQNPSVLVAAQPTRGLDVGAIEFVHSRLIDQRTAGRAILLISLELEEIRSLADRILVMYEGKIVGEFSPEVTEEELGVAMLGGKQDFETTQ